VAFSEGIQDAGGLESCDSSLDAASSGSLLVAEEARGDLRVGEVGGAPGAIGRALRFGAWTGGGWGRVSLSWGSRRQDDSKYHAGGHRSIESREVALAEWGGIRPPVAEGVSPGEFRAEGQMATSRISRHGRRGRGEVR